MELTLSDPESGAVATIEPERGRMVTRFDIGDWKVLYLDVATLRDTTKNVRGGIPVCSRRRASSTPIAGPTPAIPAR